MKSIPVSQLLTARVYDKDGTDVGHVEDLAIHPEGQRVAHYMVVVRRNVAEELGLEQPSVTGEYRILVDADRVERAAAARIDMKDDKWTLGRLPRLGA